MHMRRAKIVGTLGPASSTPEMLDQLIGAGLDVARLNFSHGTHADHASTLTALRAASSSRGRAVAVLGDLQGPKIRTGPLKAGRAGVKLAKGAELTITTDGELQGDEKLVSTTYQYLAEDVKPGERILIDDGLLELKALATDGVRVRCEVVEGGVLGQNKGINLPGVRLRADAMSEKDKADLIFGLDNGVDAIALSFVRTAEDVQKCRAEMEKAGRVVPIISKIEKPEAIENLDAIIEVSDGLMVARGDLGVEIQPERVPVLQKLICKKASEAGKVVIIATQMLNSMIEHPRPTRAEASDVANGIWDGADAVMLSGETASGRFPLASIQMMDRIVCEAESVLPERPAHHIELTPPMPTNAVMAAAACQVAYASGAVAIAAFTTSGTSARLVSNFRPTVPVVAFSPEQDVRRRCALYWGVVPKIMEPLADPDRMAERVAARLVADGVVKPNDRIVIVYGSPLGMVGKTNSIRVHRVPADLSVPRPVGQM
jgi:pyruvate kinase